MDRIQLRRDTAARWAEINPVLLEGEIGFETDTRLRKIGDGVNRWNELGYLKAEGIVQETGDGENVVMSQRAVSEKINGLKQTVEEQVKNYKPIIVEGNVTNAPDEEDITSDGNNLLKLKNRSQLYGMGYVILRRDKSFAEQIIGIGTIYEIRYNFDLGGKRVAIPADCVLKYVGGSLNNGTIVYNNTIVEGIERLNNVVTEGEFKYPYTGDESNPDTQLAPTMTQFRKLNTQVNNIADDEDLTKIYDDKKGQEVLQLKNRQYIQGSNNGMGYVILRQNKSFKEQLTQSNTIYEIRYDFDLDGEEVEIPDNCMLKFEGGTLANGVLTGMSTRLSAQSEIIFKSNILVGGTWNIPDIYSQWFADIQSDNCLKRLIAFCSDDIHNNVYISGGDYTLSVQNNNESVLVVDKADTTINIDGTLNLKANSFPRCYIFEITASNVTIKGAGCIKGDKDSHDYTTIESSHEWGYGIFVNGRQYEVEDHAIYNVRIEGLEICDFTGDCICCNHVHNLTIRDVYLHNARRQGISLTDYIRNAVIENFRITNINGTLPQSAIDIEPNYGTARNISITNGIIGNVEKGVLLYTNSKDTTYITDVYIANIEFVEINNQGATYACINSNATINLRIENINLTNLPNTKSLFSGGGKVIFNNITNGIINAEKADVYITNMIFDEPYDNEIFISNGCKVVVAQSKIVCTRLFTINNNSTLDIYSSVLSFSNYEAASSIVNFYKSTIYKTGTLGHNLYDCEVNIVSDKLYAFSGSAHRCIFNIEMTGENVFVSTNGMPFSYLSNKTIQDCQINVTATKIYSVFNLDANNGDKNIKLVDNKVNIMAAADRLYRINANETSNFFIRNYGLYNSYSTRPNMQQITDSTGKVLNDYGTIGLAFFDTTLNKIIWWNGTSWVDATGVTV